jgi:hypothetical protein
MATIEEPKCMTCIHYILDIGEIPKCDAFQNGIPEEIWNGDKEHAEPVKNQGNDLVFEPLKFIS